MNHMNQALEEPRKEESAEGGNFLEVRNALLPTLPDASAEGVDKRPHVQAENCSYSCLPCMWHITSYYQQ